MKQITIAGRVGKDGEVRRTQDGTPILGFSVAVSGFGRDAPPLWFDVSLFGKRADALSQHITKGSYVTVTGDFSTREYNGKTYFQVRANDITLQGGRSQGTDSSGQDTGSPWGLPPEGGTAGHVEDEIPF